MRYLTLVAVLGIVACSTAVPPPATTPQAVPETSEAGNYQRSFDCSNCHRDQYRQYLGSGHARSFTNPVFQAQYFNDVVPRISEDPHFEGEAGLCVACHAPVLWQTTGSVARHPDAVEAEDSGVTCDFCHTIEGYDGPRPGNANFRCRPGSRKFGPFQQTGDWHHVYSPFVTRSEFCALCHQATNRFGLVVKDTYREWRQSSFYRRRIHCQDCHMSLHGFLEAGKPVYETGAAARMAIKQLPERQRLYSHRFPGAHTESQIEGALELEIKLVGDALLRGRPAMFIVSVDNERTGHRMPTGSADLRALCLEVTLSSGTGWSMHVPADSEDPEGLDVLGRGPFDRKEIDEGGLSLGSRVYRSVFADGSGSPTVASYDAAQIIYDNRLEAGEKRLEKYSTRIPESLDSDAVTLTAELYYLPYPRVFAERFKAPQPKAVLVTRIDQEFRVR